MNWQFNVKKFKHSSGETCWLVNYTNAECGPEEILCLNSDELTKQFEIARDCCLKLSEKE